MGILWGQQKLNLLLRLGHPDSVDEGSPCRPAMQILLPVYRDISSTAWAVCDKTIRQYSLAPSGDPISLFGMTMPRANLCSNDVLFFFFRSTLRRVDLIKCVSNVRPSVQTFVRPQNFLRFQWNLVCRQRSMSDAQRYAVWPDPRSRSRALERWKSFHFQKLSPPFTMGAGNWPLWFSN